jgi:SAM-dependent methyltransferase
VRAQPAGDFDYEAGGTGYAVQRRTDPRIASLVHAALGDARTIVNVGAGAGSYEPIDRDVTAVEPSAAMRAQRPPDRAPAIDAVAEALPFPDASFDAAMAMVTIHQWSNPDAGVRELRRVSRGPVVILTFDGDALDRFWLADYAPELIAAERTRYPAIDHVSKQLGGDATVSAVPIPIDCVDGFTEAFYARPERLLDAAVRRSQSAWGFISAAETDRSVARLRADLESGEWDRRYGALRTQPAFVGSLRLITAHPSPRSELGRECGLDLSRHRGDA